jgi:hypothetical protein
MDLIPNGPRGERRPADAIGNAVQVMQIATGEIEETPAPLNPGAEMGRKGGKTQADAMTPERRAEIAKAEATKCWAQHYTASGAVGWGTTTTWLGSVCTTLMMTRASVTGWNGPGRIASSLQRRALNLGELHRE